MSATPGGTGTPVQSGPGSCCMANHGELAGEYLELNGLSMEDLLKSWNRAVAIT
ncbi:Hypothetical protein A7982_11593 [Minicystis rosea]|nr:Hypothetical protein A7982_11593 [Minicystis rosea]